MGAVDFRILRKCLPRECRAEARSLCHFKCPGTQAGAVSWRTLGPVFSAELHLSLLQLLVPEPGLGMLHHLAS